MSNAISAKWGLPIMAAAALATYGFVAPQAAPEFTKSSSVEIGTRVVRPDVVKSETESFTSLSQSAKVQSDTRSGAVRLISGGQLSSTTLSRRATKAELVHEALSFVAAHKDVFGVEASDLQLNDKATLITKDVQFLKFAVLRNGLVVQDAVVDFRFKQGKLLQVNNQTFSEATGDERASLEAGLDVAAERAIIGQNAVAQGEKLRVVADKKGYHLVKVRQFDTTGQDGRRYLIQVDAASGKVFEVRPTTFELDGSVKGSVYPRWYGETAEIRPYSQTALTYGNTSITSDMQGNFSGAPANSQPKLDGFTGTIVKTVPSTGTNVTAAGGLVRDRWDVIFQKGANAPDSDPMMAQSMAHYHLNYIINHAKAVGVTTPWFDQQLTANVNLAQTCNAYWDGSTVNFFSGGGGCANTGLISDVMYHEWGHGLDANTGGIDDGAFSEGFGDIMSLTITHSNILGIGFRTPGGEPVRDLEPNKVYPADAGEVHAEGLIIGGAFWDTYKYLKESLGEERAAQLLDSYAYKVIYTATRYTDVYAALQVIDDDNGDLSDGTPNLCIINKAFAEHGLTPADEACSLASIDEFQIDDSDGGNGNGIIEPGESIKLNLTARNAASQGVEDLVGVLSVAGANGVNVTDANLAWGSIPARSSKPSTDGAALEVANNVACGTQIATTVKLAADTRTNTLNSVLSVGRLSGTAEINAAAGLPLPVLDNQTATAMIEVAGGQWDADTAVNTAHLKFDITHTYVGDLTVKLISPDGTSKDIWAGSGATADEHYDADVTEALKGLKGKGTWKLTVTDGAGQDEGTLDTATLTLTPAKFICE